MPMLKLGAPARCLSYSKDIWPKTACDAHTLEPLWVGARGFYSRAA